MPTVLGIGTLVSLSLLAYPTSLSALEFYRAKDGAVAYENPSADAPVLYRFKAGEEFKVIGKEGTWLRVRFSTKTTGYVREAEANQSISSEKVRPTVAQKNHPAPQPENALSNEQSTPLQPEKKLQPPAPKVRVTAVQLYQEYQENEVAADEKYKDKILEISGVVDSVQKNDLGAIVVLLQGKKGSIVSHVQCGLADTGVYGGKHKAENAQKAATLRKGQQVTLRGKGMGRYGLDIATIDCVFSEEEDRSISPRGTVRAKLRPGQWVLWASCSHADMGKIICDPQEQYQWLRSLSQPQFALLAYADLQLDGGFTIYEVVEHQRSDIFLRSLWALAGPFDSAAEVEDWIATLPGSPPYRGAYNLFPERVLDYIGHLDPEERIVSSTQEEISGIVLDASYGNSGGSFDLKTNTGAVVHFSVSVDAPNAPTGEDEGKRFSTVFRRVSYKRAGQEVKNTCEGETRFTATLGVKKNEQLVDSFCVQDFMIAPATESSLTEYLSTATKTPAPSSPPPDYQDKVRQAQTDMRMLQAALKAFEADVGRYPTAQEGFNALRERPLCCHVLEGFLLAARNSA
jgi:hypothetical protein